MLLHGTKTKFDRFRRPRSEDELSGASNGFLGSWFCRETHASIAENYGQGGWIAEVEEPDPSQVLEVSISRLVDWHERARDCEDEAAFYARVATAVLAKGKSWIAVIEKDGSSPTLICLRPEQLEVVNWRHLGAEAEAERELEHGL